jgi:octaprenyl-diphosphate synthase
VLADATNVIAEGEVLQLLNCHNADVEVDDYLRVIRYKTAKLFEAASRLGGILAGVGEESKTSLAAFGMHIGTAFQLVDDVLDYSGDEADTGKHIGDDLAEGKPTLPLIHAMKHGSPEHAACVRSAIENGGRDDFPAVLEAIRATGAIEATQKAAEAEAELALNALECACPASVFKDSLIQLSQFAVARKY